MISLKTLEPFSLSQSCFCRQLLSLNQKDVESAVNNAQGIKNLTKINVLSKRIKKRLGETIDFKSTQIQTGSYLLP
jgi:hypothetical protein